MNALTSMACTDRVVEFVAELDSAQLGPRVRHECLRAFTNAVGCVVGGSRHALVDTAAAALLEFSGPPQATLIGRGRRTDVLTAVLLNGLSGAAYSFDDTYSDALLHPSGPVAAALLAVAERSRVTGEQLLVAFGAGIELACRLTKAVAVAPAKGEIAWSQTGIACGIAAALACGKLLGLDRDGLTAATGIATTEAAGTRAAHGSMAASLIFGRAAQSGARAALLASRGFSGPRASLEHPHGYAAVFARTPNLPALVEDLGERYELLSNTYKPYPCGLVIHPALDGILQLREQLGFSGAEVVAIRLQVSPLAIELGMHPEPKNDLEAKVSLQHWVAAAAMCGKAGLAEGTMEVVRDADVRRLRALIEVAGDPAMAQDAALVSVRLREGAWHQHRIEHCSGSLHCPMSDEALDAKFIDQASIVIGEERAIAVARRCWELMSLGAAGDLARYAA